MKIRLRKYIAPLADILAIPLHHIFTRVYQTLVWPELWKSETVNIIPKNAAPSDLTQLRNLSCTPLFSKLLESFVLDELKAETKLSDDQYGGLKNVGADHFLIGTWQSILEPLEDQRAAISVLSIDFVKAFNRMCHRACLDSIQRLGASESTVGLVHAFLFQRSMSVKLGNVKSVPKAVPGGSPHGSILGNYLFCSTTDQLTRDIDYTRPADVSLENMDDNNETVSAETFCSSPGIIGELPAAGASGSEEIMNEDQPVVSVYDDSALDDLISFYRRQQRHEFDSDSDP